MQSLRNSQKQNEQDEVKPDLHQPLVTIAIPTYNRLERLKKALNCALDQTYPNIEIIVLDNASNDGTKDYLEYMSRITSNLKIIRNKNNVGLIRNIQQIPGLAKGKYLHVLSDDDYVERTFISTGVADLENYPTASMWYCRCRLIDKKDRFIRFSTKRKRIETGEQFIMNFLNKESDWLFCSCLFQ